MAQWLLERKLVALNTMYEKAPQKQVTYRTPKGAEKQLDYILTDKKHCCWSREAEANDMIYSHGENCDPCKSKKKKTRLNEVALRKPMKARYRDLEQDVKSAEATVSGTARGRKQEAAGAKVAAATATATDAQKEAAAAATSGKKETKDKDEEILPSYMKGDRSKKMRRNAFEM